MRPILFFVLAGVLCSGVVSGNRAGATPHGQSWMDVEATAAELRLSGDLLTVLHRTSGRVPRPGEDWVTVHDLNGRQIARVLPSDAVRDADMVNVQEAVSAGSVLIVSVYAGNAKDQFANLLLRYELPSAILRRVARIDPLTCWYLAVDDTATYCLGGNAAIFDSGSRDFDLLHRLTHDGVLQESALRWSREFPDVGYPVTLSAAGSPSLTVSGGAVRAWMPKTGRVVTWRPGAPLRVATMPPDVLSNLGAGNYATDVHGGMLVTRTLGTSSDGSQGLVLWHDDTGALAATNMTLTPDVRVVGAHRGRLLIWDRRAQQLRWQPAAWLP